MSEAATRLVEAPISNTRQATLKFQASGNVTPLVLVPKKRNCLSCSLVIPSDAYPLMHHWGKHFTTGEETTHFAGAGCKVMCSQYRIAYLVSRQACTYNAPVASVPTKDDVNVTIDLSVVFTISNPHDFVYQLGVLRFDEYLKAAVDEGIRSLIRDVNHHQVFELRAQFAASMLQELNGKFSELGVKMMNVNITNVRLPGNLMQLLEEIQKIKSKKIELQANHDFELKRMKDQSDFDIKEIARKKDLLSRQLDAALEKAKIDKEEKIATIQERREVSIAEAKKEAAILKRRAEDDYHNSLIKEEEESFKARAAAEAKAEQELIAAQQRANEKVIQAETRYKDVERRVKTDRMEAEAEAKAAKAFAARRKHELDMRRLAISGQLASQGSLVLRGDEANNILLDLTSAARTA